MFGCFCGNHSLHAALYQSREVGKFVVRVFLILAMVVVVSEVQAASLRGRVLANGKGGPPMENVVVSAIAANDYNTGVDGKFTLTFPDMNPGERVFLTVSKKGYVVINEYELWATLPAHPDQIPAVFLMCKEGDRKEMASRYYGLKFVKEVNETLQRKIKEEPNVSPAKIAQLHQEADQAKAATEKGAEWLAKQKPGSGSE